VPAPASSTGSVRSGGVGAGEDVRPARRPGAPRARHRAPRVSRGRLRLVVFAAVSVGVLGTSAVRSSPALFRSQAARAYHTDAAAAPRAAAGTPPRPHAATAGALLRPGIGPRFAARIPAGTRQALVVSGAGTRSDRAVATLWNRGADGRWHPGTAWPAHNALRGWDTDHHAGDLHSPIGVFGLTAAGGLYANPGSRMPYFHSGAFHAVGTGFEGEPLTGAFDYVVAIDYNRVPGTSPLDARAPLGPGRGQGIWVHVDHGGPTHGCVTLSKEHMVALLRALDPADHPVIVMGDRAALDT
jgi:L,D-peptidoglycan transpeptidase YkuD (ErfK/YbiS/YcfS/YnhG family)